MVNQSTENNFGSSKVPSWVSRFLSTSSLDQIERAVRAAEAKTSGEIVPMIVRSSAPTESMRRMLMLMLWCIVLTLTPLLIKADYSVEHLLAEAAGLVAAWALAGYIPIAPWMIRLLLPLTDQVASVEHRAEIEFYRTRIQHTSAQTGILLFVSLAERRAIVLADQAIASKLSPGTWDEVLQMMIGAFKEKHAGEGIARAVDKCGDILAQHFPRREGDVDELANHLVIKE